MQIRNFFYSLTIAIYFLSYSNAVLADNQKGQAPLFNNLGNFHYEITTTNPLAQRFFDQGLVFFYGFEWGESVRSFKEATRLDPNCGMCWWGLALALGDKGNAPLNGHEYTDAQDAIKKALALSSHEPLIEQAYIKALAQRFQHRPKPMNMSKSFSCHSNGGETASPKELKAYADKMKNLSLQYPKDNVAKTLYAFSSFDTFGWEFWDINKNITKGVPTLIKTLESVIASDKLNIGGNHYYVHVIEQSPHPEQALVSAGRLKTLVPGSEHLVHMPTHIYFLTGRYHEATDANLQAIAAYQNYSKICHNQGFEPEITYLYHHDFDFLRTTAAMEGRKQLAISSARQLMDNLPDSWIEADHYLQWFIPVPYYVYARFGMWDELLKEPKPKVEYQYAVGMWHYAQGISYANIGNLTAANQEALALNQIVTKDAIKNSLGKSGHNLLKIANEILLATIASINNDEDTTMSHLKTAMKIQHDMGYHEPPDWYFPVKEAMGDAYLKWNHPIEAKNMFEQDLKQYPDNGWALYGLAKALRKIGDNQKADQVEVEFKNAWKYADIKAPVVMFQ